MLLTYTLYSSASQWVRGFKAKSKTKHLDTEPCLESRTLRATANSNSLHKAEIDMQLYLVIL